MSHTIFISHCRDEKPIADAVRGLLRQAYAGHANGIMSSDVPRGANWLAWVKENLTAADELISIFTDYSVDRPWLNIETGYAIMADKPVTPLLCRGFSLQRLPIQYRQHQAVDSRNQDDVLALYADILTRIKARAPLAMAHWDEVTMWNEWSRALAGAEDTVPLTATRANSRTVVWLMGSHGTLPEPEQLKALQVCGVVARMCASRGWQIVMGTSRMLEYLADESADYLENPAKLADAKGDGWRKQIAGEHAQAVPPAPNPVVLLGTLRNRGAREVFNEAIGRFPDVAVLIGGREVESSGRACEEEELAVRAGIPFLPLTFTGGAAAHAKHSFDAGLDAKIERLQTMKSNLDRLSTVLAEVIQEQVGIPHRR